MDQIKILVTSEYENERVDKVIASEADTLSRSFVQKIIKDQEVTVDGKIVKAGYKVSEGEEILFSVPEKIEHEIAAFMKEKQEEAEEKAAENAREILSLAVDKKTQRLSQVAKAACLCPKYMRMWSAHNASPCDITMPTSCNTRR